MQDIIKLEGENANYYIPEYYEPLLDYVEILGEKYMPVTREDYECGFINTRALGYFASRYFDNEMDKSFKQRFIDNKEVQETITALGYEADKFWYLLLFIYDYSCGTCEKGIVPNKSPKKQMDNLFRAIFDNVSAYDSKNKKVVFKSPTKIVLEIKGKHKITIEDPFTVLSLAGVCLNAVDKIEDGSVLSQSRIEGKIKNGEFEVETTSNSVHIWYFANMFFNFFELKPPLKVKQKKGSTISCSKKLLISRLIYITRLSRNENFKSSEDTLKGYLKQYKDYQINMMNSVYM